jgi:hypothetical protein
MSIYSTRDAIFQRVQLPLGTDEEPNSKEGSQFQGWQGWEGWSFCLFLRLVLFGETGTSEGHRRWRPQAGKEPAEPCRGSLGLSWLEAPGGS